MPIHDPVGIHERPRLSLADIRRLMTEIASEADSLLDVVAATSAQGAHGTSEVVFAHTRPGREPVRIVVRVDRYATASALRSVVRDHLRRAVAEMASKG